MPPLLKKILPYLIAQVIYFFCFVYSALASFAYEEQYTESQGAWYELGSMGLVTISGAILQQAASFPLAHLGVLIAGTRGFGFGYLAFSLNAIIVTFIGIRIVRRFKPKTSSLDSP